MNRMPVECGAIGVVRNAVREPTDAGWGSVVSRVEVRPEFQAGLQGLDQFSHAIVVFLMHRAQFVPATHVVRRPQERLDMPLVGIFAQRARHRPNAIGVTTVSIERLESCAVLVRGLDAIDGTPVLDIKPYVPAYDRPRDPRVPEWIERLMGGYF